MMISLRCFKFVVVAVGLLFLTACSTTANSPILMYKGIKLSDSDIVKFIVPAALDVLEVDGKEFIKSPRISDGKYEVEFLPGSHQFKVVYSRMWGSEALGSFVESDAFYFKLDTSAGSVYEFEHNGPGYLPDAESWYSISDVKIWLKELKTSRKIEAISAHAYGNLLSRYIFGGAADAPPSSASDSSIKAGVNESRAQTGQNISKQLKLWWKIANAEQRAAFQHWLVNRKDIKVDTTSKNKPKKVADELKTWWERANTKQRRSFLIWLEN